MTRPQSPVVRRKGVMGGRPCIRGTTVKADDVVRLFKSGWSHAVLSDMYRVTEDQIADAIRWHMNGRRWGKKAGRRG